MDSLNGALNAEGANKNEPARTDYDILTEMGAFNAKEAKERNESEKRASSSELELDYSKLEPWEIAENLTLLKEKGLDIDIKDLISKLEPCDIAKNIDELNRNNAEINEKELFSNLTRHDISIMDEPLKYYVDHGVDINDIIKKENPRALIYELDEIDELGGKIENINAIVADNQVSDIMENLDSLIRHNADINLILSKIGSKNDSGLVRVQRLEKALERNGFNPSDIKNEGLLGPWHYQANQDKQE